MRDGSFWHRPARGVMIVLLTGVTLAVNAAFVDEYKSGINWAEPVVVDPGPAGGPPSDARVLFNGKSLDQWQGGDKWEIRDGFAVSKETGINTKDSFGDCQLHLEWASPEKVEGEGQGRGNSGVYLMGRYEVQILDSFINKTYFDGQAGSLYKQTPPMVNACRKPGEWQTYDIIFNAPRMDDRGKVIKPATITVLHNGVLIQNNFEFKGGTFFERPPAYDNPHPEKGPIHIQFHGNPVRFRNIWVREIKPAPLAK